MISTIFQLAERPKSSKTIFWAGAWFNQNLPWSCTRFSGWLSAQIVENKFSDNFLPKFFKHQFLDVLKNPSRKEKCFKNNQNFLEDETWSKNNMQKNITASNMYAKWAKTLPIRKDSKIYPPRLLLSVFCSKSYDQSRSPGSSREAGRRRSVACMLLLLLLRRVMQVSDT